MLLRARKVIGFKEEADIHDITAIRRKVFGEEQGIDYQLDFDGLDERSTHIIDTALDEESGGFVSAGTVRFRHIEDHPSPYYVVKLERMAVLPQFRKGGVGKHMLEFYLACWPRLKRGNESLMILNAQVSAQRFYERLSFLAEGEIFQEAGIDHISMSRHLHF